MKEKKDSAGLSKEENGTVAEELKLPAVPEEKENEAADASLTESEVAKEEQTGTAGEVISEESADETDVEMTSSEEDVQEDLESEPEDELPGQPPEFEVARMGEDGEWHTVPIVASEEEPEQQPESERKEEREPSAQVVASAAAAAVRAGNKMIEKSVEKRASKGKDKKNRSQEEKIKLAQKIVGTIAGIAIVTIGALSLYVYQYPSIFYGVRVAQDFKLSGMSEQEAQAYIENECKGQVLDNDVTVSADGKEFTLHVADVAHEVDSQTSAHQAYLVGRQGGYFQRMGEALSAMVGRQNVPLSIGMNEEETTEFVEGVYEKVQYDPVQPSWKVDKKASQLIIDTGKTGLDFDQDQVLEDLEDRISNMNFETYEVDTVIVDQEKPDAEEIAKDVNTDPKNATVDKEDLSIIHSVSGVKVDEDSIKKIVGDATEQTYTVPVEITKANVSGNQLEKVLFRDVLSEATTYYNGGQYGRTNNLTRASEACDGVILNPGEVFSYNDEVGERTAERGYSTAIIFVDGQSIEDYGGGVCQPSSTIYMAVLRADLEVVERGEHMFRVTYTPISQDAAVAYGSLDFRFKNNTEYPIKINMLYGGGALTCQIIGTKTDDKSVELYSSSYSSGGYTYAELYKTVTVNGESTTVHENSSAYSNASH